MNRKTLWLAVAPALGLVLFSGCRNCCRRECCSYYTPPAFPAPAYVAPNVYAPAPAVAPPAVAPAPLPPPAVPQPPAAAMESGSFAAPSQAWQPAPGPNRVQLSPPVPSGPDPVQTDAAKTDDQPAPSPEPPLATPDSQPTPAPPAPTPALPVSIPLFAVVREQVAIGLEPFADGFEWLANQRYRTVLHLRAPDPDDANARQQVEQLGMRYVSLVVTPQTLTPETLAEFNRLVADASAWPLFVYDRNGQLAAVLWYLHFQTVDGLSDEEARDRVRSLSLRLPDRDDPHGWWLAMQKTLAEARRN
ncbi:MAG: fused DSP-PTPase phosphatase/NAD kinase-like protein [Gemmataceae bacterium]